MKKSFKKFRAHIADNWRPGVLLLVALSSVIFLLTYKLGSLLGGMSASEYLIQQGIAQSALSAESLLRQPLYLPYYLVLYLIQFTPFDGPTAVRGVSALFGIGAAGGFFYILHKWYTARIALLGTILLVTSTWFLFYARLASPDSSYLLLPLLIAGATALHAKQRSKSAFLAILVFGMLLLYVPGVVWFLLPAVIIQRKVIIKSFSVLPLWFTITAVILALLLITPLVAMVAWPLAGESVRHNLLMFLGLPASVPSFSLIFNNLTDLFGQLFLLNPNGPASTVGRLPWLDIGSIILMLIGVIQFGRHYRLDRSKLIAVTGIISIVLLALGGAVSVIILLPFIYLLICDGLRWLLEAWLEVFPRNPVAQSFGIFIVSALVLSIATYHASRYFIAWPSTPETRAIYSKTP